MNDTASQNHEDKPQPREDLLRQAKRLGLDAKASWSDQQLAEHLANRRHQIESLDWGALMDIMTWAQHSVPTRPDKLAVARIILAHRRGHYQGLSHRGLVALAILRNVRVKDTDTARKIISRLRRREGIGGYLLRKRDKWLGSVLSDLLDAEPHESGAPSPPPDQSPTLKEHIEQKGLIEGLGSGLRGAADGYIREKMEEIEARIDYKLDEIDRRLAEWRNRELANRLRMIRITLVVSVIIALLSLAYTFVVKRYWP